MNLYLSEEEVLFFEQNFGLLNNIVYKYNPRCLDDYQDIIQMASVGMIKAIKNYNNKYKFSTYATKVINNEIKTYLSSRFYREYYDKQEVLESIKGLDEEDIIGEVLYQDYLKEIIDVILKNFKTEKALNILNAYLNDNISNKEIAKRYSITPSYVSLTINKFKRLLKNRLLNYT